MLQGLSKRYDTHGLEEIDTGVLETIDYDYSGREEEIKIETDEFTAVCPYSGLPDFGTIRILYQPTKKLIELRSLKYYLFSYRNVGIYQENLAPRILDDLVKICKPRKMKVEVDYKVRGGIHTVASIQYGKK